MKSLTIVMMVVYHDIYLLQQTLRRRQWIQHYSRHAQHLLEPSRITAAALTLQASMLRASREHRHHHHRSRV